MSHTPNYMDKANEKGSGDIQQKRASLLADNPQEDDNMDRLQAAAECLLYMQNDNDTEQRPEIDVLAVGLHIPIDTRTETTGMLVCSQVIIKDPGSVQWEWIMARIYQPL